MEKKSSSDVPARERRSIDQSKIAYQTPQMRLYRTFYAHAAANIASRLEVNATTARSPITIISWSTYEDIEP